eukprot:365707-Chlamydomonas_euryale.AAC.43
MKQGLVKGINAHCVQIPSGLEWAASVRAEEGRWRGHETTTRGNSVFAPFTYFQNVGHRALNTAAPPTKLARRR